MNLLELPLEIIFIILNILMKIDPISLIVSVPYVSKHMRFICSGVRGEFDLDKFEWWTRCLVHDPRKPDLMTKFFGAIVTVEKYFPQSQGIKGIKGIDYIQVADTSLNNLRQTPRLTGNTTSLKELNLSGNQLIELPESIGRLTSLEKLELSFNQLTNLPETIGCLTSLIKLSLFKNQLTELPDSIGCLESLEDLDLGMNSLTSIPESIGCLESLVGLWVQNNKLTSLPRKILSWKKPKQLSLMWNSKELYDMRREVQEDTRNLTPPLVI